MQLDRRSLVWGGLSALACTSRREVTPVAQVLVRPVPSLPTTELPWLTLRDHFVATVGPAAGQGSPLGPLLVLADATFAPRSRFPLHPHREMEILSLVLDGELSHHGDQASGSTLPTRGAQLISARTGIVHAEGNDTDAPTRMLQIWFQPNELGGAPAYHQRVVGRGGRQPVAGDEVLPLRCDAKVWLVDLEPGRAEALKVAPRRRGYLLALDAPVRLGEREVDRGGGAQVGPGEVALTAARAGAALWIDVAA